MADFGCSQGRRDLGTGSAAGLRRRFPKGGNTGLSAKGGLIPIRGLGPSPTEPEPEEALTRLQAYPWPGNVRELENAVERELIRQQGHSGPLRFEGLRPASAPPPPAPPATTPIEPWETVSRRYITRVLQHTGGKIHGPGGAAEIIGINPNTLRSRMRKLGIPFGRPAAERKA
jgi:DNA-binding NtrC family response regulator